MHDSTDTARAGRGRKPQEDMTAAEVVRLLDRLDALRLSAWLDGGWGVDALLLEQHARTTTSISSRRSTRCLL